MRIDLQQIKTNFKGDYCFTHARSAVCPNGRAIITTQPLLLKGSDVFFGMHNIISDDAGKSWGPIVPSKTITRRQWGDGFQQVMCDRRRSITRQASRCCSLGMTPSTRITGSSNRPGIQPIHVR